MNRFRGRTAAASIGLSGLAAAGLALVCLCASPAHADKLVIFKNGKALRVKSITHDGKWMRLEFDGKDFLAVPASGIATVEDSFANSAVGELKLNQVAVGSGGVGGGGYSPPPPRNEDQGLPPDINAGQEQADADDAQAALVEEQAAKQNQLNGYVGAGAPIGGRRGRALSNQQQQMQQGVIPGIPGGLQPIGAQPNQPFNNRGGNARTRGLNQRPNN